MAEGLDQSVTKGVNFRVVIARDLSHRNARGYMVRSCAIAVGFFLVSLSTFGQSQYWSNADLASRNLPREQYNAIGQGHQVECKARGVSVANQLYPPPRRSSSAEVHGNVGVAPFYGRIEQDERPDNPIAALREGDREERWRRTVETTTLGCMAEKGWVRK